MHPLLCASSGGRRHQCRHHCYPPPTPAAAETCLLPCVRLPPLLRLQGMPLQEVEQLMQDGADAKAYEDSLRQLLGKACQPASQPACLPACQLGGQTDSQNQTASFALPAVARPTCPVPHTLRLF